MCIRDRYWNIHQTFNPQDFKVVLSGNYMHNMTLCGASEILGGSTYKPCNVTDEYLYTRLVGRRGYWLYITNNNTETRRIPLEFLSSEYDADAGNGDFNPDWTEFSFVHSGDFKAGETVEIQLTLKTAAENKRYNDWIDASRIELELSDPHPSDKFTVIRMPRGGSYTIRFTSQKANDRKIIKVKIDGKAVPEKNLISTIKPMYSALILSLIHI
eukprot:TRINITY_DN11236_c0_g1_i1.p1 TRINITY_DN11236_c0_g1~~TRINITY_DN11236_c0_g1_i1.p1  ORF type:complete len:234 (-),score=94.75 TRINITY_DN11236_c0_g1_i1:57-698(-)